MTGLLSTVFSMRYPLFGLALLLSPALASAGEIELTPQNTHITFAVRHLAVSEVDGDFPVLHGTVRYGSADTDVSVDVEIGAAAINTGIGMRDKSLRNSYLDAEHFPTVKFTSSPLRDANTLPGTLDLKGIKAPIVLQIEKTAGEPDALAKRRHIVATTVVSRKTFGISGSGSFLTMADEVRLRIEIDNPAAR
jgi:polyisoprenoid-binding protein YceI